MRFVPALAASLSLLSGIACGGGDLVLPEDQFPPAEMVVFDGDQQAGPVGAQLDEPLVVRVLDDQQRPVQGVRVAFQLGDHAEGGGLDPDTALTNTDGLASSHWVLGGTSGRQEVDAEVVGASLAVTFSADAERTSTFRLELESGDEQMAAPGAELAAPLVVRLLDGGDGAPGRAVAWVVATGGGTAAPTSSDTDADGFASTTWTLGPDVGPQTLNAVVSGVGVVSFTATAVGDGGGEPSPGLSTVTASPTSIEAGTGLSTITVTVRDGTGAPVPGAIVILAATGSGNNLNQPTAPTGANGVATGTLQSVEAGTKVVSAVVNGAVAITATATVTVTETPEPDHLEFLVEPSNVQKDEVISPAVEVAIVDEQGRVVPLSDVEIELELIREDGRNHQFDGDDTRSTVDGVAVFADLSIDHDHDDFRFRASVPEMPELGSVETGTFPVED